MAVATGQVRRLREWVRRPIGRGTAVCCAVLVVAGLLAVSGPKGVDGQSRPSADLLARQVAARLLTAPAVRVDGTIATRYGEELTLTELYVTPDGYGIGTITAEESKGQILLMPGRLFFRGDQAFMKDGARPDEMGFAPSERVEPPDITEPPEPPPNALMDEIQHNLWLTVVTTEWVEAAPSYLPAGLRGLSATTFATVLTAGPAVADDASVVVEQDGTTMTAWNDALPRLTVTVAAEPLGVEDDVAGDSGESESSASDPDETAEDVLLNIDVVAVDPATHEADVVPALAGALGDLDLAVSMRMQAYLDKLTMSCSVVSCTLSGDVILVKAEPVQPHYQIVVPFRFATQTVRLPDCSRTVLVSLGVPTTVSCSSMIPAGIGENYFHGNLIGFLRPFGGPDGNAALQSVTMKQNAEVAAYGAMPGAYQPRPATASLPPPDPATGWLARLLYRIPSMKIASGYVDTHGIRAGALVFTPATLILPMDGTPPSQAEVYRLAVEPAIAQADVAAGLPVRWCLAADLVPTLQQVLAQPSAYLAAARDAGLVEYGETGTETLTDEQRIALVASVAVLPATDPLCAP